MSLPFLFLLLAFAAYRLTRFITADTIPGSYLRAPFREGSKLHELVTCEWCAGVWTSAALVAAVDAWWHPLPLPVLWFLSVATAVGLASSWDASR